MRISDWSSDVCSSDLCIGPHWLRPTLRCGRSTSSVDADVDSVPAQGEGQAFALRDEVDIDAARVLEPQLAGALVPDDNTVPGLPIGPVVVGETGEVGKFASSLEHLNTKAANHTA